MRTTDRGSRDSATDSPVKDQTSSVSGHIIARRSAGLKARQYAGSARCASSKLRKTFAVTLVRGVIAVIVVRRAARPTSVPQCRVDFARELASVRSFLLERRVRSAVIGGVALAAYGHSRLTLDLDIVTEAVVQDALIDAMESRGFVTLHRSVGYSNHRHPQSSHGRVDFMYVRGETAERLFAAVRRRPGPGGEMMDVPRPEHLVAMKVRAIADAPERMWQDLADIGYLVRLDGVDRDEVRGYFERAGLGEKWREIERSL